MIDTELLLVIGLAVFIALLVKKSDEVVESGSSGRTALGVGLVLALVMIVFLATIGLRVMAVM